MLEITELTFGIKVQGKKFNLTVNEIEHLRESLDGAVKSLDSFHASYINTKKESVDVSLRGVDEELRWKQFIDYCNSFC